MLRRAVALVGSVVIDDACGCPDGLSEHVSYTACKIVVILTNCSDDCSNLLRAFRYVCRQRFGYIIDMLLIRW